MPYDSKRFFNCQRSGKTEKVFAGQLRRPVFLFMQSTTGRAVQKQEVYDFIVKFFEIQEILPPESWFQRIIAAILNDYIEKGVFLKVQTMTMEGRKPWMKPKLQTFYKFNDEPAT